MILAIITTCLALSFLLLPAAWWYQLADRRRACLTAVGTGLAFSAVAIIGGFGEVDPSLDLGLAFSPIEQAKCAIGIGLLHFAIGWGALLSRRDPTASPGFIRTRAVSRPRTIPCGFSPPVTRGPATGPRLRPKTRTSAMPRPVPAPDVAADASTPSH
jgi:hypothetical protein